MLSPDTSADEDNKLAAQSGVQNLLHIMYRAFNIKGWPLDNSCLALGKQLNDANSKTVRTALDAFVGKDGRLDGDKMLQHWFPKVEADVFISHSHKDRDLAIAFAGFLSRQFKLKPFVDSCVWGHADALQRAIDDVYSKSDDGRNYVYEKLKLSAGHVHLMLSTAIATMVDTAECIFFLNTPSSINISESVSKTASPWLYYELALMRLIRQRDPAQHRSKIKMANFSEAHASNEVQFHYEANLASLTSLSANVLDQWNKKCGGNRFWPRHALDELYAIAPERSSSEKWY